MNTPQAKTTILSAPPGWGKTRQAQQLMRQHGCHSVVDNWQRSQPLTPGALHLTNQPPVKFTGQEAATLVFHGWPMRHAV